MNDDADDPSTPDASAPVPAPPARRGGGFAGPSDSAEAAGARRVERRRLTRRWIAIGIVVVAVAAAIRFTPLLDVFTGDTGPDELAGIDEAEQEGLLVVTEGERPGALSISVMKKPWPIPPVEDHDPADREREPWEKATDTLAADLRARGARPWNAHTSRELSPAAESLLDVVLDRLNRNGVRVIHYKPKRRGR